MTVLAELREVHLSRNRLTSLPESTFVLYWNTTDRCTDIGQMSLTVLDVADNQITRLPFSLRELKYLSKLELDNNPLLMPPAHICARGRVHIFKFLKDEETKAVQPPSDGVQRRQREVRFLCLSLCSLEVVVQARPSVPHVPRSMSSVV